MSVISVCPISLPYNSQPERYRVVVAGICALILTVGLARFAYTPMLPVMRSHAGLTDLAGGWLATINYAGYMSGALLAANIRNLSQKFILYRIGLVLAIISTGAMGLTDNVFVWAALRYVAGFSSTAGLLLASGLVLNWLIRHGYRPVLGLHFTGLGLGVVVSGMAVAGMMNWLPWHQQWLGLGLIGFIFFIPAWRWLPAPAISAAPATPVVLHGAETKTATELAPGSDATSGQRPWMPIFIASYFCAGWGFVISATFIVTVLEKLPVFAGNGGWVWVIVGLTAAPSGFFWDHIARISGQIPALMLAFGLQSVSLLLPAITSGTALNLMSAILFGLTFVGIVSLTLSLIGRSFPENPAKAMARLTLSYGVAQIIAPALAGYIATTTGSYQWAQVLAAGVMASGMVFLYMLNKYDFEVHA